MARSLVRPLPAAIGELSDLYMRNIFAPTPLSQRDIRRAMRVWSDVRWRLALVNALLAASRPFATQQSSASTHRDLRAP